ncbi:MAG: cadherin repeat domain-containing protein, partial [Planctomycetota bacterium]
LLDRYWLSAWRRMKVLHPPQIASVALDVTSQVAAKGETVYTATVKDADPNHESQLKYALKSGREDDAALLTVEPATGIVKFRDDVEIDGNLRKVHFTLIVEDPAGLTDEKDLEINLRAPQKQGEQAVPQAEPLRN